MCIFTNEAHTKSAISAISYVYQCAVTQLFVNDYPLIQKSAI